MTGGDLLSRARREGTPLVDGQVVTFVWEGEQGASLGGDMCGWKPEDLLPLSEHSPGVWIYQRALPLDAYIQYALFQAGRRVADPFNPRRTPDGFGHANHYFYMPQTRPSPLVRRKRGSPPLRLIIEDLETGGWLAGRSRRVHFWQPPVEQPCPLLVMFDGRDYLHRARLPQVAANLIAAGRIQPLALALLENDPDSRLVEYTASEAAVVFIRDRLLPMAHARLNLVSTSDHPGTFAMGGASVGGLMALYTALRLPADFGSVLSQSGAFTISQFDLVVYDLVSHAVPPLPRVWMDCGLFDPFIGTNRRMAALLVDRGFEAVLRENPAGHNFTAWRNSIHRGLEWLYPPQRR